MANCEKKLNKSLTFLAVTAVEHNLFVGHALIYIVVTRLYQTLIPREFQNKKIFQIRRFVHMLMVENHFEHLWKQELDR